MLNILIILGKIPIIEQNIYIMSLREDILPYAESPITHQLMLSLLKNYKRPNDKINELVKQNELIAIKKGLYIPGPELKIAGPEPFLLANHLRGPSYVSLESALSYWKLIPERVYEISSVTTKAGKIYNTPLGRFSYHHTTTPYYSFGIKSIPLTVKQVALIASPEKAICDKIVMTSGIILRSPRQVHELLFEDLRIDEEAALQLNTETITTWLGDAPKRTSLEMLITTIKSL